jgi:enoyl-CoA hydratase/carnithine racemase
MTMHLGLSKNIELSLTGELISGRTAYEIGILNHLVPQKEVLPKSLALAADMAKLAPTAMRLTKQRFRKLTQPGFEAALEEAKIAQKEAYASGEPQEAMRRFLDARKR